MIGRWVQVTFERRKREREGIEEREREMGQDTWRKKMFQRCHLAPILPFPSFLVVVTNLIITIIFFVIVNFLLVVMVGYEMIRIWKETVKEKENWSESRERWKRNSMKWKSVPILCRIFSSLFLLFSYPTFTINFWTIIIIIIIIFLAIKFTTLIYTAINLLSYGHIFIRMNSLLTWLWLNKTEDLTDNEDSGKSQTIEDANRFALLKSLSLSLFPFLDWIFLNSFGSNWMNFWRKF